MSRWVTIATIGPARLVAPPQASAHVLADRMLEFWTHWLMRVLPDQPDLIVVPELCARYENLHGQRAAEYAALCDDRLRELFVRTAREHRCYVVYPTFVTGADGTTSNAAVVFDRNGKAVGEYHKNHLVIGENTENGIRYGRRADVLECDFGRMALAICFDLNFDELRQKYVQARPDLIVFVSEYHGGLAQQIWAYTCRSHFVGAIAGPPSEIRNPFGQVLHESTNYRPFAVGRVNLDCCLAHLDGNWQKLEALKAKYGPAVEIHDPGYIGSVLISSLSDDVSAVRMAREFQIELLDEYFARSLAHRHSPGHMEP